LAESEQEREDKNRGGKTGRAKELSERGVALTDQKKVGGERKIKRDFLRGAGGMPVKKSGQKIPDTVSRPSWVASIAKPEGKKSNSNDAMWG